MSIGSKVALLSDVGRALKPRTNGLSVVLDTGWGVRAIHDMAEVAGAYCDMAKIAWGSALITANLSEKLAAYRAHGIEPLFGGTLFEYAYLRGSVPLLVDLVKEHQVRIEISDGVVALPRSERLRWIEAFSRVTEVYSEIGGKVDRQQHDWKQVIAEDLAAGARRIVVEGREISPVGQDYRVDFVDAVVAAANLDLLVFEALERRQQVWLIKRFGPNVNLANIRPEELLTVESFRRGLKEHTLLHVFEGTRKP